jgi:uncharacterized protein (TIGR00251 family)
MPIDVNKLDLRIAPDRVEFTVKVVPGSARTEIVGLWDTALKIAVAAPPEGGKANAAVLKLLAARLGVRKTAIAIVRGKTHPVKRIAVADLTAAELRNRLAGA